jgi:hypothetical protein
MAIDMASVYAARYRKQPDMLRAAVMGQSPDPKLDSYTALNALRLVKEADMMDMAGQAQQPTSSPSIVAQNLAPNPMQQGLGAMMPMGAPAGQMPQQRAPMPQPTMQAASGGLAGMYTPEEDYAEGGIVAFNLGGETEEDYQRETSDTGYSDAQGRRTDAEGNLMEYDGGTDNQRAFAARNVQQSRAELMGMKDEGLSQDEFNKIRQDSLDFAKRNAGPDIYAPANRRLKEREDARSKNVSQGQGLALLAAAGAILEGNTLARGASKAFPVFAQQMGEVQRADINEQRSIENMQFSLADAQRKERMGDIRGAQAAAETARKEKNDANRFRLNKAQALARLDADVYKAVNRPNKGAGGLKYQEQILQNNVDYFKSTLKPKPNEAPEAFDARVRKMASDETARALKTSFSTGEIGAVNAETKLAPTLRAIDADVINKLQEFKDGDRAYKSARRAKNTTEMDRLLAAEEARLRTLYQTPAAASAKSSAAPAAAAPKPTTTGKAVSMADVRATVTSSGRTEQEVIDALKAKGYTIK